MKSYNGLYYAMGVSMGWVLGATIGLPQVHSIGSVVRPAHIQSGYVDASKLEIILEDSDANKKQEVVLKYHDQKYSLIENQDGKLPHYSGDTVPLLSDVTATTEKMEHK